MPPPPITPVSPVQPVAAYQRSPVAHKPGADPPAQAAADAQHHTGEPQDSGAAGFGTVTVYLPGQPSDWISNGSGTYTNRHNSVVKVTLGRRDVVQFYQTASAPQVRRGTVDVVA